MCSAQASCTTSNPGVACVNVNELACAAGACVGGTWNNAGLCTMCTSQAQCMAGQDITGATCVVSPNFDQYQCMTCNAGFAPTGGVCMATAGCGAAGLSQPNCTAGQDDNTKPCVNDGDGMGAVYNFCNLCAPQYYSDVNGVCQTCQLQANCTTPSTTQSCTATTSPPTEYCSQCHNDTGPDANGICATCTSQANCTTDVGPNNPCTGPSNNEFQCATCQNGEYPDSTGYCTACVVQGGANPCITSDPTQPCVVPTGGSSADSLFCDTCTAAAPVGGVCP